jgi:hypothetical protein
MDAINNERVTAGELVSCAQEQGVDLESLRNDSMFQTNRRWIFLWRKVNGLPATGPVKEKEGTLHYNMQGVIAALPNSLKDSAGAFQGMWTEAGTLEYISQALDLVKAWLVDEREVDSLPKRRVRRFGI